jgi:hypothetical protein
MTKNAMARLKRRTRSQHPDTPSLVELLNSNGNISEWFANETAKSARAGDTDAAREILEDFVGAINQRSERMWPQIGPPIHWAYARYLADAFQSILEGKDAKLALGVKNSKPGRRPGKTTHNAEALAAAYWYLIRRGFKPERANLELQKRTGADRRTIQIASKKKGNAALGLPGLIDDETLKVMFKPYAAQIHRILTAAGID